MSEAEATRSGPALLSVRRAMPRRAGLRGVSPATACALAAGLVAAAFVAAMLAATDGHFVPQVVDLYVVCQYARAIAEGHPFQYNPGEPPSTGATSPLFTLWLALAHAAGVRGEGLVAFAIATGAIAYAAAVVVALRLGRQLASEREGWLAAALVALGGPVVWGFLYGSDIALFMLLALWLLERMVAASATGRHGEAALAASLIALLRPEGLLIAVAFALFASLDGGRFRWRPLAGLPLLAAAALLLAMRALTGQWVGSSLADKSLLANYGVLATVGLVADYAVDVVRGLLLGFYPSQAAVGFSRGWASLYFPPLGLLLVLAALVRARPSAGRAARWWAATAALCALAVSPNVFLGVHFNRYVLWAVPGLLVLAAVGLGATSRLIAGGDTRLDRALFRAGAGLLVALGALSTARFAVVYADMAADVYRRDVAVAQWITRSLPRGIPLANMATSVESLTGHLNLNLHGVTTPAFFGVRATERDAGALEALGRLPAPERPRLMIVSRAAAAASPLARAVVSGPPVFATATGGDEIEIHPIGYDRLDAAAAPRSAAALQATAGLQEVDRLNVADAADEAAHRYRARTALGGTALGATVRIAAGADGRSLADAGRAILGRESFELRTTPGRDLVLVLRTAPEMETALLRVGGGTVTLGFSPAAAALTVNGRPAGMLGGPPDPGWHEWVVRVPGEWIDSQRSAFELAGRYASFRYWAYQ